MNNAGVRFIRRQKQKLRDKEPVCIQHYQAGDSIKINDNVRKRKANK